MRRFVLTSAAQDDLREIFEFIRQDNPGAAGRVLDEIWEAIGRLSRMPEIGHFREDLSEKPVRFWSVYSYLIIYRPDTRPIQVVRVLHGARDVRRILQTEE